MLRDFLFRVKDYGYRKRGELIKWGIIILLAAVALWAIWMGVEFIQSARYSKRVETLENEIKAAESRAKDAESRAEVIRQAIDQKYEELKQISARADAAEGKLRNTRSSVVTLKEEYETVRYVDRIIGPVSCLDTCEELARLGYPCK